MSQHLIPISVHRTMPDRGATFSVCGRYRYRLWRQWSDAAPMVFCMLNPSTADAKQNDPTVERCQRRAERMGYGGVEVVNLFAWRATDPHDMKRAGDPVGPLNNTAIQAAALRAGMLICAWGNHGGYLGRAARVVEMLTEHGHQLHALRVSKTGQPCHPLYLPNDLEPTPWTP